MELNIQTNMKGLCGPSQLTNPKLKMRMITPVISSAFMFDAIKEFTLVNGKIIFHEWIYKNS